MIGQKTSRNWSKPVFLVFKYLQKHGNWQLQLEKDQTGSVQFGPMYISVL